jgi:hypothetical protein
MDFRKIASLIIILALLDGGSVAAAASRSNVAGVARSNRFHGSRHIFIVRQPFPIQRSTGTVSAGTSRSRIDSRIDSRF